uniref:Chloride channel protein n=2 Tax=Minutocellus polymorphus TaxID=265543 RepID=A0A7S0B3K2_9STRA
MLYVGAAIGRAFGLVYEGFDVRTYAILGAAASLNGVVRVLISLPAIMMETTTISTFVSPLMIVCLVSRYIGNGVFRSEGIYDEILKIRKIPFLEEEPPKVTKRLVLRAKDVMSMELVQLQLTMQVQAIFEILQEYNHLDFPVTDPSKGGQLVGSISRATLKAILWKKALSPRSDGDVECEESSAQSEDSLDLSYDQFEFDRLEEVSDTDLFNHLKGEEKCMYMSLARYMTLSPIAFGEDGSAERAFELFRTLGLRQLVVVDSDKIPIGVVTRFDLKVLDEEEDGHDNKAGTLASNGETATTVKSASLISMS